MDESSLHLARPVLSPCGPHLGQVYHHPHFLVTQRRAQESFLTPPSPHSHLRPVPNEGEWAFGSSFRKTCSQSRCWNIMVTQSSFHSCLCGTLCLVHNSEIHLSPPLSGLATLTGAPVDSLLWVLSLCPLSAPGRVSFPTCRDG